MKKDRKKQNKPSSIQVGLEEETQRSIWKPAGIVFSVLKRRTKLARENEDQYRRIGETANEGSWEIDKEARTVFVNRRLAEMLGRSAFAFLFPEDYPEGERRLESAK